MNRNSFIIAIDIGGSTIKTGLVAADGKLSKILRYKTAKTATAIQKTLQCAVKELTKEAEKRKTQIIGIGIGCPGPLDTKVGKTLNTPNIPQNMELKKPLWDYKLPLQVENDANCFGMAEAYYGGGKNTASMIGITLGTGFGSCFLIEKKLYTGRGNAIEFGHTTINFDGEITENKLQGTVEYYISKAAQLRYATEQGLHVLDPKELHQLAEKDNQQAKAAFATYGFYLGIALANIINILDPELVMLGGACANSYKFFKKAMEEQLQKRLIVAQPPIAVSSLQEPGILGAAGLFKQYSQ